MYMNFKSLLSPFWVASASGQESPTSCLKRQHSFCENASRKKQERLIRRLSGTLCNTRLEGNRMSIPHRILMADHDENKHYSRSLAENENNFENGTKQSSSIVDSYSQDSTESSEKHSSLPRMKSYDAAVFDVTKVNAEEFASQITLMDSPVFKAIQPDELTSCAWTNREKLIKAPNIVMFTRRFNHVNFWVQREILNTHSDKSRSDVVAHFIKIAKTLSRKDKSSYEKMADLFSENNNRQNLRDYMDNVKLPCIPYLGLYLTDLIYIDVAHPHHGGLESHHRKLQMNNILRVIADLQQSNYDLEVKEHVQNYLKSVRYIEELQKFVEDDNYKLSLKLEPPITHSMSTSREDVSSCPPSPSSEPHNMNSLAPIPYAYTRSHWHRKSKSLSTNFLASTSTGMVERTHSLPSKSTAPYFNGERHLLDDSVLEESPSASSDGSICNKGIEIDDQSDTLSSDQDSFWPSIASSTSTFRPCLETNMYQQSFTCEGCVRRKTTMKAGKKPTVAAWSRYWVALWGTNLLYFPAKTLLGVDRDSFKSNPNKMKSVVGWMVVMKNDPAQPDAFQLTEPLKGITYKFRAGTQALALSWCHHLSEACKKYLPRNQQNLMSFD